MMKAKRLSKRVRLSLFAISTLISVLLIWGLFHLSAGLPLFYIGLWFSGFAACLAPVAFFTLPIFALWDLIATSASDRRERIAQDRLVENYILGDDGEIVEIADSEQRKRGADSAVE